MEADNPSFIAEIRGAEYDPNLALLELLAVGQPVTFHSATHRLASATAKSLPTRRRHLLRRYSAVCRQAGLFAEISATKEVATHKAFYEAKLSQNGGLLAIPTGIADEQNTEDFHKESEGHAARARRYILDVLPKYLPNTTLTSPHGWQYSSRQLGPNSTESDTLARISHRR